MGRRRRLPSQNPLNLWLQHLLELVFPARCFGCGASGAFWCQACNGLVVRLTGRLCPACGEPVRDNAACVRCRRSPFPFPVRSVARYQGPLARALVQLKYRPSTEMAAVMAGWLEGLVLQEGWTPQIVVPVPLGRMRQRQRGYNQVALIARSLAGSLGIDFRPEAIQRIRETRSQVGLDAEARRTNVQGAFQAKPQDVQNSTVCLVDDLMTTGATLVSCAEALRLAGCRQVLGLSVGRV
jgi:ComF family protein